MRTRQHWGGPAARELSTRTSASSVRPVLSDTEMSALPAARTVPGHCMPIHWHALMHNGHGEGVPAVDTTRADEDAETRPLRLDMPGR